MVELLKVEMNCPAAESKKSQSFLLACSALFGGLGLLLSIGTFPFLLPAFRRFCLPYLPCSDTQLTNILEALKGRSGKLIDLGSGDGRIVLAAAKSGFDSTGVELNPWLVLYSRLLSFNLGLQKQAKFCRCDLWNFNLKPYNNIVIFGVESMMEDLEKKFEQEVNEGTQIIACRFPLPNTQPIKVIGSGIDTVWIYVLRNITSEHTFENLHFFYNADSKRIMSKHVQRLEDRQNLFLELERWKYIL